MPQTAPMSWALSMMIFMLSFLIFNSPNFFGFKYLPYNREMKKLSTKMNWMW